MEVPMLLWMAACSAFGPGGAGGDGSRLGQVLDTADTAAVLELEHPWVGPWTVTEAWCGYYEGDGWFEAPVGVPVDVSEEDGGGFLFAFETSFDGVDCIELLHLTDVDVGVWWETWHEGCSEPEPSGLLEVVEERVDLLLLPEETEFGWALGLGCGSITPLRLSPRS